MLKKLFLFTSFFCYQILFATSFDYVDEAIKSPIAFSVVREDPLIDLEIIKRYFPEEKIAVLMIASGGETAAELIAETPLSTLTLVDPNLAQLDLTKLKIQLMTLPPKKRMEILGYLPMNPIDRKTIISGLMDALDIAPHRFGDIDLVARSGLDCVGRYEKVFEELRAQLKPFQKQLEALFSLTSIKEQSNQIAPGTPFGNAIDKAFDEVMSQNNLVKLFGEKATANRVQDFSRHFAERTRAYLATHLASSSPWVAYMFLGHFYEDVLFPWLNAFPSQPFPKITYFNGLMDQALEQSKPESYDMIHLSNILDWLTPNEAEKTLQLAYRALKPGGAIIIRQLNSTIDIPSIGKSFEWNLKTSNELLGNDRSFFYRKLFLGFKPRPSSAPQVQALADATLKELPVINGSYFKNLPTMSKEKFQASQMQFFFAVNYFSRPMSALIARLPLHKQRIDIIHNIVEEHGDFILENYHANTFKKFLNSIGIDHYKIDSMRSLAAVNAFNYALMGVSAHGDPIEAIACNGIIEYAFADISALIGQIVVEREWVKKENLIHYNLHAAIDKKHAEEFFEIIEPYMQEPENRERIISGLKLGVYIFNRLYEDLTLMD